jgi:hypothetical protein
MFVQLLTALSVLYFYLFGCSGIWTQGLTLANRCSNTRATPPAPLLTTLDGIPADVAVAAYLSVFLCIALLSSLTLLASLVTLSQFTLGIHGSLTSIVHYILGWWGCFGKYQGHQSWYWVVWYRQAEDVELSKRVWQVCCWTGQGPWTGNLSQQVGEHR